MSDRDIILVLIGAILIVCSCGDVIGAFLRGKSVSESVDRRSYPLQNIMKGRRGNDIANA